jgi:uncharacterized protein (TIGR02265 family)
MPADADDLKRRLDAATPRDTVRGLIFNATFALVRELAGAPAACETDPRGEARRHEFFSYPVADYLRVAWAAVAVLEPRLGPPDRVFWEIGSRCAMRWLASPLGHVMMAISGGDPRRLLASAPVGYGSVVSYGARTVEWIGERHARLVLERDFLVPSFHCGVITRSLLEMGSVHARAEVREAAFLGAVIDVTW